MELEVCSVADVISMRIQPDEGIAIRFTAKVPGAGTQHAGQNGVFLRSAFGEAGPDAYERLLLDVIRATLPSSLAVTKSRRSGPSSSQFSTSGRSPDPGAISLPGWVLGP